MLNLTDSYILALSLPIYCNQHTLPWKIHICRLVFAKECILPITYQPFRYFLTQFISEIISFLKLNNWKRVISKPKIQMARYLSSLPWVPRWLFFLCVRVLVHILKKEPKKHGRGKSGLSIKRLSSNSLHLWVLFFFQARIVLMS